MKRKDQSILQTLIRIAKIITGSVIFGVGIQCFFHPAALLSGGVTGIAMIINYLSGWPVGMMMLAMNLPLFLIALRNYGWRFLAGSILGTVVCSVSIDLLAMTNFHLTTEPLLAAIYGGVITGLGLGIVYSTGSTTGGTDVVAKLMKTRFPYVNFGTLVLILDAVVISIFAVIFGQYDHAMYTVVGVYLSAKVIDLVLYGSSPSKLCYIISARSEEIKQDIVNTLERGVTMVSGKGAYSGLEKQILICVVKRQQIVEIKGIVKNIDTSAFVIVTDTRDVFGEGFGDITMEL